MVLDDQWLVFVKRPLHHEIDTTWNCRQQSIVM